MLTMSSSRTRQAVLVDQVRHPAVREGEFVSVVGPSGCGKTTILGLVAGLMRPSGTVQVGGALATKANNHVGYMMARDALLPWKSTIENVELGLCVRGAEPGGWRKLAVEWIRRVGRHMASSMRVPASSPRGCASAWRSRARSASHPRAS